MRQEFQGEVLNPPISTALAVFVPRFLTPFCGEANYPQSAGLSWNEVSVRYCMSSAIMTLEILFSGFMSCPDDGVRILV